MSQRNPLAWRFLHLASSILGACQGKGARGPYRDCHTIPVFSCVWCDKPRFFYSASQEGKLPGFFQGGGKVVTWLCYINKKIWASNTSLKRLSNVFSFQPHSTLPFSETPGTSNFRVLHGSGVRFILLLSAFFHLFQYEQA